MTWAPLLLTDPSPCLRRLVLTDILDRPANDPEVLELETMTKTDPLVTEITGLQKRNGSWETLGGTTNAGPLRTTAHALSRLGFLGLPSDFPSIRKGVDYLFSIQQSDGSWPLPAYGKEEGSGQVYSMMPLQTALPLRGIAMCGYADNPKSEKAYEWLLKQQLSDGAWPTGLAEGVFGRVAGYRKIPHSQWGCRSNTTAALICLAYHPEKRTSQETRKSLDLILGRETRDRAALGFETARLIGLEPLSGFLTYFARFDLAVILNLCRRIGIDRDDERVLGMIRYLREEQNRYGLWQYYSHPRASRWVTFDILRSLKHLDSGSTWISREPRTPFQTYPKRRRRY